ncbi:hypothetical protein Pan216_22640 [Planctomycetes bacterium Pan216]|uniref:DUF1223 domain-containing protein n=1 Tax=Kolteria novifilia TaxID=2527975 RepID=A0A518B352_9BACT|nr:hypothetical protein Pan216_22640 [Planctomycetes bacterium Pan216]
MRTWWDRLASRRAVMVCLLVAGLTLWTVKDSSTADESRSSQRSKAIATRQLAKRWPKIAASQPRGLALVELYTSEGCSSCPPADALLSELATLRHNDDLPIYALEFHVDYWNYLGWEDPFSRRAFTDRQRHENQRLETGRVYTPQMIINGIAEIVGSRRQLVDEAVGLALEIPEEVTVRLRLSEPGPTDRIDVDYTVAGASHGALLSLALVESGLANEVDRGENAGRHLVHANVVRAMRTLRLDNHGKARVRLPIPEDLDPRRARVIGFVQDGKTLRVLGASDVTLDARVEDGRHPTEQGAQRAE